jgi:hypothetical protein
LLRFPIYLMLIFALFKLYMDIHTMYRLGNELYSGKLKVRSDLISGWLGTVDLAISRDSETHS